MAPRALELSRLREVSLGHRSLLIIVTVGVVAFFFISRLSPLPASSAPLTAHIIYLPLLARGSSGATLGGCQMFPATNIWNTRIDALPLDPHSADYIDFTGRATSLHPDFGANWNGGPFGIPFDLIPGTQPMAPISFDYSDESDPGPYPVPANPSIEKGSDAHMLLLDTGHCVLYETWNTRYDGGWQAGSGAKFDLNSNALRPATWTSAGAAGLPILPGLVRYEEVMAGEINHAIRFTVKGTNNTYIWPARHRTYYNYRVEPRRWDSAFD